jgi:hypothetical protein
MHSLVYLNNIISMIDEWFMGLMAYKRSKKDRDVYIGKSWSRCLKVERLIRSLKVGTQ